jgi:hypothetical protein
MFKPGGSKPPTSGRKKGTPNQKSVLVRETLEAHGINLVEQILVRLPQVSRETQIKALVQMLPYVYPKLISTEITAPGGFRIVIEDYVSTLKDIKKDG